MGFVKATKAQSKLRMALIGPSGSGKTYTALSIGKNLGDRIAMMDTERGSASKYAGDFDFDVMELTRFHPQTYIDGIKVAESEGYDVLIIDSLSHAWMGKDGALELVDKAAKRSQGGGNSFGAWREVTPLHNALIDAILDSKMHVIVTMRSKMEYVQEKDEKGKTTIRKVGLQPIQRDGMEYEFDVIGDLDSDNNLVIGKTRCSRLSGGFFSKAGADVAKILRDWLSDGTPEVEADPIRCEWPDCGEIITGTSRMSAAKFAEYSREQCNGAVYCLKHGKEYMAAMKAAAEGEVAPPDNRPEASDDDPVEPEESPRETTTVGDAARAKAGTKIDMATAKQVQSIGIERKRFFGSGEEADAKYYEWLHDTFSVASCKELTARQATDALQVLARMGREPNG